MARTAKSTTKTDDAVKAEMKDEPSKDKNVKEIEEVKEEPLLDDDEIAVMSIVPNVSYYDKTTYDDYEWRETGDIEYMTVASLVRMHRNHRDYFEHMKLKPLDERVIKKLGIERLYDKYDFFMDESSYTVDNIDKLMKMLSDLRTNDMRIAVLNKVKEMVSSGKITDVKVLRNLENRFGVDLISYIQ